MSEGRFIMVVGEAGTPAKLGQLATVKTFLETLVAAIEMRPLAEPTMFDVPIQLGNLGLTPFQDEGGVTGNVVLSTSHISIHTWPVRNHYVLHAYSCRDFDHVKVIQGLDAAFDRGRKFSNDLSAFLKTPTQIQQALDNGDVTPFSSQFAVMLQLREENARLKALVPG